MPSTFDSSASTWIGRIFSGLVVAALTADGLVQIFASHLVNAEMEATGFPVSQALPLGIIMLVCAVLYALPRTAVLGAILVTGFLGGAICTHFRLGELGSPPQFICLLLGVLTWGGLYLRDARLRALLPIANNPA
jgi:DoxX-like family